MKRSDATTDLDTRLNEARARRDGLMQSLLAMNGGDPDLYSGMGRNEGYDSLLCALRSEQAVIDDLQRTQEGAAKDEADAEG